MEIPVHQRLITLQYREEIDKLSNESIITLFMLFLQDCILAIASLFLLNVLFSGAGLINGEIEHAYLSAYGDAQVEDPKLFFITSPLTYILGTIVLLLLCVLITKKFLLYFALKNLFKDLVRYSSFILFLYICFCLLLRYNEVDQLMPFGIIVIIGSCVMLFSLAIKHRSVMLSLGEMKSSPVGKKPARDKRAMSYTESKIAVLQNSTEIRKLKAKSIATIALLIVEDTFFAIFIAFVSLVILLGYSELFVGEIEQSFFVTFELAAPGVPFSEHSSDHFVELLLASILSFLMVNTFLYNQLLAGRYLSYFIMKCRFWKFTSYGATLALLFVAICYQFRYMSSVYVAEFVYWTLICLALYLIFIYYKNKTPALDFLKKYVF